MTSIGIVSPSARTRYECNECDEDIHQDQPYLRSKRDGYVLKIHLHCAVPLIKHGWIWYMRLPNGEELTNSNTTDDRWNDIATN